MFDSLEPAETIDQLYTYEKAHRSFRVNPEVYDEVHQYGH
jgi:hypothetical protein